MNSRGRSVKLADGYEEKLSSEWTRLMIFTEHRSAIWTLSEDQRLFNSYKKIPKERIMALFPGRTWGAIKRHASNLGIPRKGLRYTPEEDSLLEELYNETELTYRQMTPFFKLRDHRSLESRMHNKRRRRGGG